MIKLKEGDTFKSKTTWKSKFKGKTFIVKKVTGRGSYLCHVIGSPGHFYITPKRSQQWIETHIQLCKYRPLTLENK